MAREKVKIGSGITARSETRYSGSDMLPAFKAMSDQWRNELNEAGNEFGVAALDFVKQSKWILEAAGEGPFEFDSPPDYARRILQSHMTAQVFITKSDPDMAAREAFHLGALCSQAMIKHQWESHALRGLGTLESARAGHRTVHGTEAEKRLRWKRLAVAFERERGFGKSKTAAGNAAAQQHGVSFKTVMRAVKNLLSAK